MPTTPRWQLQKPLDAIIFDCDGTLTSVEGIDELAAENNVGEIVKTMTAEAMTQSGINPQLYRKRLELVMPRREQVEQLGNHYYDKRIPDASDIIQHFQAIGKTIYLISAGLSPAVIKFGEMLSIPRSNILAVNITFDNQGQYINFDDHSPFTQHDGKRRVVAELKARHGRVAHIGDGMNDFIAHDISTRFIGYGGIYYRKNIAEQCGYYIKSASLSALLPLLLTEAESQQLTEQALQLYKKGLADIYNGMVEMNDISNRHTD